jgi:hypothetical protein
MDDSSTQQSAAARALLGDELASPRSQAIPTPAVSTEPTLEIPPPPLPELSLEFGTDIPAIQRGAAWCLAASLIWTMLGIARGVLPELYADEAVQYATSTILLFTAFAQLNGLSHLQLIEPIHRAREYLALSWFLFLVMAIISTICFIVIKLQIDGGLVFAMSLLIWLAGVGSFWSLLFGLRRVGIYVGELRIITQSYLCQILLGFLFAASVVKIGTLIQSRPIRAMMKLLPDPLLKSLSTISPTLIATAGVVMLLYIHCLWLLWRAAMRAQRQARTP